MKVISSWPDYARSCIFAVTEDGELFGLPIIGNDALLTEWIQYTGPIKRRTFPRVPPTNPTSGV